MKSPKKSLREQLAENQSAMNYYARMAGKEPVEMAPMLKPKRERASPSVPSDDIEAPVQSAIADLLSVHPRVLWAIRQNSGAMRIQDGPDRRDTRYIHFYRFVRRPNSLERVTIVDFVGQLKDGTFFAIEAKKPSWKRPTDDRELAQLAFIDAVKSAGGIGLFATCVEDVIACLL